MSLKEHAKHELGLLGMSESCTDAMNKSMYNHIMSMVDVFEAEGHSGFSAAYAVSILQKLLRYEPLSPLTGEDSEWIDVGQELGGKPIFQNSRCSHVFRDERGAYDINGKVFRSPNGSCYTNHLSRTPVVFPYTPKTEYVDVPE